MLSPVDPDTNSLAAFPDAPLCLNFTNTVSVHDGTNSYDHLSDFTGLVDWCTMAGIISRTQASHLKKEAAKRGVHAKAALSRAVELREAMYRVFSAVAREKSVDADDLHVLNEALSRTMGHAIVLPSNGKFAWGWDEGGDAVYRLLWPIARSAADLLTSNELDRVEECGSRDCAWLFLDTTKNHSRRFCSSTGCGNRTRVRRYHERMKHAGV